MAPVRIWRQCQYALTCLLHSIECFAGAFRSEEQDVPIDEVEPAPGEQKVRIERQGLAGNPEGTREFGWPLLVVERSGAQIFVIRFGIARAALLDGLLLVRKQLELQGSNNSLGYLVLQREDIRELAVVTLGPDLIVSGAIDQLRGNAYA